MVHVWIDVNFVHVPFHQGPPARFKLEESKPVFDVIPLGRRLPDFPIFFQDKGPGLLKGQPCLLCVELRDAVMPDPVRVFGLHQSSVHVK